MSQQINHQKIKELREEKFRMVRLLGRPNMRKAEINARIQSINHEIDRLQS